MESSRNALEDLNTLMSVQQSADVVSRDLGIT